MQLFLISGDEILAINGKSLQGLSHDDAINEFRAIKNGQVILQVAKREIVALLQKGYCCNKTNYLSVHYYGATRSYIALHALQFLIFYFRSAELPNQLPTSTTRILNMPSL